MPNLFQTAGACAGLAGFALSAPAQLVVVPNNYTSVEGDSNNAYPFSNFLASQRYQQVHGATEFAAIPGPHRITAIRLRPDASFAFQPWTNTVNLDLRFSTTPAGPDGLSTTFASNTGPDETVVYSGQAVYGSNQSSPGPVPGPWAFDIQITFQTPFVYNPALGNLLMDVRRDGTTVSGFIPLDASDVVGNGSSRMINNASTATTGFADSTSLVIQFVTEPAGNPCYANCDGSTTPPVANVADFTCFLQKFAANDPYANCDGSTTPPVINVADFTCFLQKFAAGCP